MAKTLRIGMIGYRFMGKAHSNAWRQAPQILSRSKRTSKCTRSADVTPMPSGNRARVQLGWQNATTDWREIVESPLIDIVDINTPNDSHAEIAIAAAQNGKHVLCEKPLG